MRSEPVKPARADFYLDLGLSKDATRTDIRKSFHALARLHHPDKKAPAQTVDAVEFRQRGRTPSSIFQKFVEGMNRAERTEKLMRELVATCEKQARLAAEHKAKQAAAAQRKRERRLVRDREKAAKAKAADATTQATAQRQREENERKARSRKNIEQIE
ncbi:hypothetical protein IAQ61_005039 [Plenodomus lingam]|uniref:uncharacterized protein n=1 Tax=Leptosphaeria maculans TaxID=5022 RepID=UPI00332507DF|nr:hypothetical protein IAQ61_005039 [Plenodomus lingam]